MDMWESYHVMKWQDFLYKRVSYPKWINNKIDANNVEVRNQFELNQVGYESKCIESKKIEIDPLLIMTMTTRVKLLYIVYDEALLNNLMMSDQILTQIGS